MNCLLIFVIYCQRSLPFRITGNAQGKQKLEKTWNHRKMALFNKSYKNGSFCFIFVHIFISLLFNTNLSLKVNNKKKKNLRKYIFLLSSFSLKKKTTKKISFFIFLFSFSFSHFFCTNVCASFACIYLQFLVKKNE